MKLIVQLKWCGDFLQILGGVTQMYGIIIAQFYNYKTSQHTCCIMQNLVYNSATYKIAQGVYTCIIYVHL